MVTSDLREEIRAWMVQSQITPSTILAEENLKEEVLNASEKISEISTEIKKTLRGIFRNKLSGNMKYVI